MKKFFKVWQIQIKNPVGKSIYCGGGKSNAKGKCNKFGGF